MSIDNLYKTLLQFPNVMELENPLSLSELEHFQNSNKITIPRSLVELFSCFDGGELFIPGTIVYGVNNENVKKTIKYANRKEIRDQFDISKSYLIIGKLNFGDFICINLNSPYQIIQWDHEKNEEYCTWESLEEWLSDMIADYKDYEDGEK